jgi:hypothetical protein
MEYGEKLTEPEPQSKSLVQSNIEDPFLREGSCALSTGSLSKEDHIPMPQCAVASAVVILLIFCLNNKLTASAHRLHLFLLIFFGVRLDLSPLGDSALAFIWAEELL